MADTTITTATYTDHINAHSLVGSRSGAGRTIHVPPRPIDPEHVEDAMELVDLSGKGRLVSFSVVPIASTEMIAAGYGKDHPHCVGIIALDEGPSISAQIVGIDVQHPETVVLGTPMVAEYLERATGEKKKTILAFRPAVQ